MTQAQKAAVETIKANGGEVKASRGHDLPAGWIHFKMAWKLEALGILRHVDAYTENDRYILSEGQDR